MSTDVNIQLRSYLQTIEASAPPITVAELKQASGQPAAPAHESGDDDLMVDYLRQRPDDRDTPSEQKRWHGIAVAVAATILLVIGIVLVADGNSGEVVIDTASTPSATGL